jgi:hypothetical protein
METILKTYNLFLDTRNRDSGTHSDATFNLVKPLTLSTKGSSYFRIKLISAVIPFSFTQINSSNNIVNITINSVPNTLTIPYGNYNIINLLAEIKKQLLVLLPTNTFGFTYSNSTNKVSMIVLTGSAVAIEIFDSGKVNSLTLMLGFTSTFNFSNVITATSQQNVNVSPAKSLFIRSATLLQSQNYESIITKNNFSDIIGQVQIYNGSQSFLNFYDANNFYSRLNNVAIDNINLYITDATNDNEIINLMLDSSYCLEIQEILQPSLVNSNGIQPSQEELLRDEVKNVGTEIMKKKSELLNELERKKNKNV